jgi:hypothetical protein
MRLERALTLSLFVFALAGVFVRRVLLTYFGSGGTKSAS